MRIAIHQPNYIPWCGYFAKMRSCDVFVFLDDAEISTSQSYVYRSKVRNETGPLWLSVPTRRKLHDLILGVRFADSKWSQKHLNKLHAFYHKCFYFDEVYAFLAPIYQETGDTLADFNVRMIRKIADYLGLGCRFERSSFLMADGLRDDRHISLARIIGANTYLSGKGGQNYQDPAKFAEAGIELDVRTYTPIPYKQIHGDFIAGLSILDALFHLGRDTIQILEYSSHNGSTYERHPSSPPRSEIL